MARIDTDKQQSVITDSLYFDESDDDQSDDQNSLDLTDLDYQYKERKLVLEFFNIYFRTIIAADQEHIINNYVNLGNYQKRDKYRENGYFYINDHTNRKKIYGIDEIDIFKIKQTLKDLKRDSRWENLTDEDDSNIGIPKHSDEHAKLYLFDNSDYKDILRDSFQYNFLSAKAPYANQAHHLLPEEIFNSDTSMISDDFMSLLMKIPYDIDHGENIIFLPEGLDNCPIHKLPTHCGSHPSYNQHVLEDINLLQNIVHLFSQDIRECNATICIGLLNGIIRLQNDYWDLITNFINDDNKKSSLNDNTKNILDSYKIELDSFRNTINNEIFNGVENPHNLIFREDEINKGQQLTFNRMLDCKHFLVASSNQE